MTSETEEWIAKAEADFSTAGREYAVKDNPNYDAVCFHSQQCAEKLLKAWLVEHGMGFPRTHDLEALLNRVARGDPSWEALRVNLAALTSMGVEVRYPGMFADYEDATEALRVAGEVRNTVRRALRLD